MTPRKGCPGEKLKWTLENGSLLVMQGDTQLNWKVCGLQAPEESNRHLMFEYATYWMPTTA